MRQLKVWLTAPGSHQLARQATLQGFYPICEPLFEIKSLVDDKLQAIIEDNLSKCQLAICVSKNVPHILVNSGIDLSRVTWATVGPSSAALLRDHGVTQVIFPKDGEFGSEALVRQLKLSGIVHADMYIMLFVGADWRDGLYEWLSGLSVKLNVIELYSRLIPKKQDYFKVLVTSVDIVVITCRTSLDNLLLLCRDNSEIYRLRLLVVSERIKTYALDAGFQRVELLCGPRVEDILVGLEKFRFETV